MAVSRSVSTKPLALTARLRAHGITYYVVLVHVLVVMACAGVAPCSVPKLIRSSTTTTRVALRTFCTTGTLHYMTGTRV